MNRTVFSLSVALTVAWLTSEANAGITFDYSNDGGFFASHLVAKAAVEKAAADINAVINYNLGAITKDITVGTSGGSTVDFDFKYTYTNPSSGASVDILNTAMAANEVRIFVGMRNLSGTTLGQGGPGGVGFSASGLDAGGGTFAAAVNNAVAVDQHGRGGGPTISVVSGAFNAGAVPFSFNIGSTVGNLWFDSDTNNDGLTDNDATLNQNWHFDSTTAVAGGKSDFYSVALHETLHAMGFGTSQTWNSLVTGGDDWTGANAIAAAGTGVNIIDLASGAHIASGIMSTRLSDGGLQETVMSPSITVGTRKSLTALDVAFLQDLNYSIVAVPEPSSMLLIAAAVGMIATRVRRKKSSP